MCLWVACLMFFIVLFPLIASLIARLDDYILRLRCLISSFAMLLLLFLSLVKASQCILVSQIDIFSCLFYIPFICLKLIWLDSLLVECNYLKSS